MGDLEFIQEKVLAGDYFQVSGDIDNLNNTIEFVVPNGKTAFLIEAHVSIMSDNALTTQINGNVLTVNKITANLQIDGVEKDRLRVGNKVKTGDDNGGMIGGASGSSVPNQKFQVLGLSLNGNGAKKIEIKNILDNGGNAFATMSGYLV